jgi:hypothetical protein
LEAAARDGKEPAAADSTPHACVLLVAVSRRRAEPDLCSSGAGGTRVHTMGPSTAD